MKKKPAEIIAGFRVICYLCQRETNPPIPLNDTITRNKKDAEFDLLFTRMKAHDDRNAFRSLFEAFFAPLCVFSGRFIPDTDAVKDIVEDVFVALWEHRDEIEPATSVRAYLQTATRNRCLNVLKHDAVQQRYVEYVNLQSAVTKDTDELLVYEELQEQLNKIVDSLPDTYRIAFVMGQLQEEKTSAIAKRLQVSERTVERLKLKARQIICHEIGKRYSLLLLYVLYVALELL